MTKFRIPFSAAFAASAFFLAACGGGDTASDTTDADMTAAETAQADAMATDDMAPMASYMVSLTGDAERPAPVATKAIGETSIMVHGDSISYAVNALDITGITAVHFHRGGAEETGGPIVTLFSDENGVDPRNGSVSSGVITRETQLADGVTFDELKEMLRNGNVYVNIHTKNHPAGEIRGQVGAGMM